MTWRELKIMVEKELTKKGQSEDIEIDYMDFNGAHGGVHALVVEERSISGQHWWSLTVQ